MNMQFSFLASGLMVLSMCISIHCALAQNLSDKSNEVSIKRSKEDPLLKTGPLPVISWIHPNADFASSAVNKMDLHATVKLSSPAKEIKLAVRNSEDGMQLVQKSIKTNEGLLVYEVKVPVTLPDGSYNIELEVITTDGVAVSEKRRVMIGQGALDNVLSLDRKDYALLFGTDKYDHWTDLVNPIDDVRAIGKELKEKYGFQVEIVENPGVEDIWKKLRELNERKFSSQDQLFVFFAGHGHYDETFGEGYVVAKNSLENDLSRNSYISHNRLRGVIRI